MSETKNYTVTGMTCGHCVASITEEVTAVEGVEGVEIDLPSGRMTVAGSADVDAVRSAVEEAGYKVAE